MISSSSLHVQLSSSPLSLSITPNSISLLAPSSAALMSRKDTPAAAAKPADDIWSTLDTSTPRAPELPGSVSYAPAAAAARSTAAASSPAASTAGSAGLQVPDDGRIRYSCLWPTGIAGGMGVVMGLLIGASKREPVGMSAFQGAASLATNAALNCALAKFTDASMVSAQHSALNQR